MSRYNQSVLGELDDEILRGVEKIRQQPTLLESEFLENVEKEKFMNQLGKDDWQKVAIKGKTEGKIESKETELRQ